MISFASKKQPFTFRGFFRAHSSGIYGTALFHLGILIILLSAKLYSIGTGEASILLDFSEQEAKELVQRKEQQHEALLKELNAQIASHSQTASNVAIRNAVVNRAEVQNQPLSDDRHADPSKLYDEARKVQEQLDASRQQLLAQQGVDNIATPTPATTLSETAKTYQGPSVVSYDLGDRKAMSLPVPAYQCIHGGDVTVLIEVDRQGYVKKAGIDKSYSSPDKCLHDAALTMARLSRFTVSANAPNRQQGNIVYRFIAQ
jgi:outer membrane biosynthesis protein TonB